MNPSQIDDLMNLQETTFTPFKHVESLWDSFNKKPTLPLADKIMGRMDDNEIELPPTLSAEIRDFIMRKRANGLPESYIRECVKKEFNITEIK